MHTTMSDGNYSPMEIAENASSTEEMFLFKNSNLEIYKWNRQDTLGFLFSVAIVL